MSGTPVLRPAPIVSHPQPPGKKVDSEADVEALLEQYEDMKVASEEGEKSFIWPEGSRPDIVHDNFDFEFPVIDMSPVLKFQSLKKEIESSEGESKLRRGLEEEMEACEAAQSVVATAIREACEEYGFFQIINHGFDMEVVEQLRECYRQIMDRPLECRGGRPGMLESETWGLGLWIKFACIFETKARIQRDNLQLPLGLPCVCPLVPKSSAVMYSSIAGALPAEKMKVKSLPFPDRPSLPGYTPMKRDTATTRMAPAHIWNEGMDLESPETFYVGRLEQLANIIWPGEPEKGRLFRSSVDEYGKQSSRVTFLLLDLIAASLALPKTAVKELLGDPRKSQVNARLRVNNYPVFPQPEMTFGAQSHTDPDIITLLHQDEVGGLQIRFRDGTWHGVKPLHGAFVVNCGDFLQAWTNGRFLSAEHRAVANEKSRRMSIVYFAFSEVKYVISPRPECVNDEHPARYRPFTMLQYIKALLTFGLGNRGELLDKAFGIRA